LIYVPGPRVSRLTRRSLAVALVCFALVVFSIRGPMRGLKDSGDFAPVYAASRCWLARTSPYQQAAVDQQYMAGHGDPRVSPNPQYRASVYAPSVFPLVSTISWLGWERAKRLWLILGVVSFAVSLACVAGFALASSSELLALLALFLLFSPVQTGISKGQPSVICISWLLCALYLQRTPREEGLAGLLLGFSCCIKPNLVLPFVVYHCWRRRWRVAGVGAAVVLAVSGLALWRLAVFCPGWRGEWLNNLKASSAPGGSMDPTIASPFSHLLVNLQTVPGLFTADSAICNIVVYGLVGGLTACVVVTVKSPAENWLLLALLSTLVLLGSYHRYYDFQLLMLGCNGMLQLYRGHWRPRLFAALAAPGILLWFPLQALASRFLSPPHPGAAAFGKLAWEVLAFRNQPLCLLALATLFAWAAIDSGSHAARDYIPVTSPPPAGPIGNVTR